MNNECCLCEKKRAYCSELCEAHSEAYEIRHSAGDEPEDDSLFILFYNKHKVCLSDIVEEETVSRIRHYESKGLMKKYGHDSENNLCFVLTKDGKKVAELCWLEKMSEVKKKANKIFKNYTHVTEFAKN